MSRPFFLFLVICIFTRCSPVWSDPANFQSVFAIIKKMKVCALHFDEGEKRNKKELLELLYSNESCLLDSIQQSSLEIDKKEPLRTIHQQLKMSLENLLGSQQTLIRITLGRTSDLASELAQSAVLWKKGKGQFNEAVRDFTLELEYGNFQVTAQEKEALKLEFERIFAREMSAWQQINSKKKSDGTHLKASDDIWRVVAISEALDQISIHTELKPALDDVSKTPPEVKQ